MNASAAGMNPQPLEKKPAWSDLLAQSYRLDGERFWTLFRIALLPAAFACFWPYVQRIGVRQLWGMGWIGFGSPGKFAVLVASGWVDGAFYWTLSGFFFAAVASNILADPDKPMPPFSDAYTRARNRISLVMVVAMICWTLFWIGRLRASLLCLDCSIVSGCVQVSTAPCSWYPSRSFCWPACFRAWG